jgi:hypothetical protein
MKHAGTQSGTSSATQVKLIEKSRKGIPEVTDARNAALQNCERDFFVWAPFIVLPVHIEDTWLH